MGEYTDAELKAKFDEIDLNKEGSLSLTNIEHRKRIRKALHELGNTEDEIDLEVFPNNYFTFSDFKGMVKGHRRVGYIHDIPVLGAITSAIQDSLVDPMRDISDVELKATFKLMDVNRNGHLDKTELAQALRQLGKSEFQIEKNISEMEVEEIDMNGFRKIFKPKVREGASKIHDIPFFGIFTQMAQDIVVSTGGMIKSTVSSLSSISHETARKKFDECDDDTNGELDQRELARALRELGKTEAEIKQILDRSQFEKVDFTAFKYLARSSEGPLAILGGSDTLTDKELKEKFDEIDTRGNGVLDLTQIEDRRKIREALHGIDPQKFDENFDLEVVSSNVFTFSDFKGMIRGQRSQLDDVPVLGTITSAWADNMPATFGSGVTDVELLATFQRFDVDKSGKLDKDEVTRAMREMGESEAKIKNSLDMMQGETVDYKGFLALVIPKARGMTTTVGGVTVPNLAKVHDVPVVGAVTHMAQNMMTATAGFFYNGFNQMGGSSSNTCQVADRLGNLSIFDLRVKFDEFDTDHSGLLEAEELGQLLQSLGKTESEVEELIGEMDDEAITFENFQAWVNAQTEKSRQENGGKFWGSLTSGWFSQPPTDARDGAESSSSEEWDFENAAASYEEQHPEGVRSSTVSKGIRTSRKKLQKQHNQEQDQPGESVERHESRESVVEGLERQQSSESVGDSF